MTDDAETPAETNPAESAGAESAGAPDETEALRAEVAQLKEQVLRVAADAENTKRRAEREANDARHFAIHPDLGIIINRRLKNSRGARNVDIFYARRDCNIDPVPIETKAACRTPRVKCRWIEHFPFRIIEIRAAGVRGEIVGLDRLTSRLLVRASRFEIDWYDFRIAVTPLTFDNINTFFRR